MEIEKLRLTHHNSKEFNLSERIRSKKNFFKSIKNSQINNHYKLIKNLKKEKSDNAKMRRSSNSACLNKNKIAKKYKILLNNPGRRINSTKTSQKELNKKLNFLTISGNDSYFDNDKFLKDNSNLNSYRSANIKIIDKICIKSLSQERKTTIKKENKNKIDFIQKKIDSLAKNLNLFQYKKIHNNLKNLKNPFKRRLEKISQTHRDFIKNYNNKLSDISNGSGSSLPSKIMQNSAYDKSYYSKISKMPNIKFSQNNSELSNSNEVYKVKETNKIDESKEYIIANGIFNEVQKNPEKKIMKNKEISARIMESKDEFLYKKIFEFNKINQKRKPFNVIDNRLNIFYSENIFQYNQKINKMNKILAKQGKPLMHLGIEQNSQKNMDEMNQKVLFMKKIVDYIYPNMVLYKVKQANKKLTKYKNLNFRLTGSQLSLSDLRDEKRKIDTYFSKSLTIRKCLSKKDYKKNEID